MWSFFLSVVTILAIIGCRDSEVTDSSNVVEGEAPGTSKNSSVKQPAIEKADNPLTHYFTKPQYGVLLNRCHHEYQKEGEYLEYSDDSHVVLSTQGIFSVKPRSVMYVNDSPILVRRRPAGLYPIDHLLKPGKNKITLSFGDYLGDFGFAYVKIVEGFPADIISEKVPVKRTITKAEILEDGITELELVVPEKSEKIQEPLFDLLYDPDKEPQKKELVRQEAEAYVQTMIECINKGDGKLFTSKYFYQRAELLGVPPSKREVRMLDKIAACISDKAYHLSKKVGFSENAELQYIVGPRTVCVFADPGGRDELVSLRLQRNPDRLADMSFSRPHTLTLGPFMLFKYKGKWYVL